MVYRKYVPKKTAFETVFVQLKEAPVSLIDSLLYINVSDDDMYGNAPWMGTLRHVSHENKVTSTFTAPQFKRYPDEDAPNPFSGMQGRDARPAYPLTPAAIINGNAPTLDEKKDQMADVDRIRSNLRETRTVSSALLKVLMPWVIDALAKV